jgi:hypothetical protein
MLPSAWLVVGFVDTVVPALWQSVHVESLCRAWLPVFGPYAAIATLWQAEQPLPVVPQVGVGEVPTPYTLAWQDAVEQVPA